MTLMGLSLVLFARPISGNGTSPDSNVPGRPQSVLPNSLLGDYGGTFEGAKNFSLFTNYFYDSKQNEVIVTEMGSALVSYAINRWLRKSPAPVLTSTEGNNETPILKKSVSARPQLNLSLSGGPGGVTLQVGGHF